VDSKHTCTNTFFMITGLGCQASRHKFKGNSTVGDIEREASRQLPKCQLTRQTQCNKDDDLSQYVHEIACHEAWQTLFLSHLGIDDEKRQHVCETSCENETSLTLFLVWTWTQACPRMMKKISMCVRPLIKMKCHRLCS